jgi:hypothetical protein
MERHRAAQVVAFVPDEFGFVSKGRDRYKTAPANGIVSAILVESVNERSVPAH